MMPHAKPMAMGLVMGPIMLWMLHGQLTQGAVSIWAAIAFIGAHFVILIGLGSGALLAARLSPFLRGWLARVHRPSLRHFGGMVTGILISSAVIHFSLHGIG